ncbi:S46 family peptidase [Inhella gelatinilytica]|uniref:Dipeptidyl-peptidase n=1 Tax=Inhella gelatinilytica TaxID=2795030 RepID=A0A931ITN3_9BURK|nr:S46 family peptidase [Inhella gelatinilytica]MBH9552562.1 S46 family peptidase [Inhella gelatinilytica]
MLLRALPLVLSVVTSAHAADGMWPLDRLPHRALADHLGQPASSAWVAKLQGAALNLDGASGSFVSKDGLVLTNHHVVSDCIDRLSTAQNDLAAAGFVAAERRDERPCPGMTARLLLDIQTVELPSDSVGRRAALQKLEAECPKGQHCELVSLYGGAVQQQYRYLRFTDLRLVMAPETQAANFGGDDDNFAYPRFAFDFALLRVYHQGQPWRPAQWLRPAAQNPKLGDAIFVPGHPWRTDRLLTVAQLTALRDAQLPAEITTAEHEQAVLHRYAARNAESARQALEPINGLENGLKAKRGEWSALKDLEIWEAKVKEEGLLRRRAESDAPWQVAEQAARAQQRLIRELLAMKPQYNTALDDALTLAALQAEAARPAAQRLETYDGATASQLAEELRAPHPFHAELETLRLTAFIERAHTALGATDPFVRALLGPHPTAQAAAKAWLAGTQVGDAKQRARWLALKPAEFGRVADPLIQLARALHPLRRAVLEAYAREVTQPLRTNADALAQARWKVLGDGSPPDATGTLRLSFGRVAEVVSGGQRQPWFTTLDGLWARHDGFGGKPPFDLAPRLAALRRDLPGSTPLNFICTADIIGGNSGSPAVNADGDWVGVVFDGNLDSLAGRFAFDERGNRATVVHQAAIRVALRQLYAAAHLAQELGL